MIYIHTGSREQTGLLRTNKIWYDSLQSIIYTSVGLQDISVILQTKMNKAQIANYRVSSNPNLIKNNHVTTWTTFSTNPDFPMNFRQ